MKIHLTDSAFFCCPDTMKTEAPPDGMTERVKAKVMREIQGKPSRRSLRIFVLAAVIAALFSVCAYGVFRYSMEHEKISGTIKTHTVLYGEKGEVLEERADIIPEAGMKISITGPEQSYYMPEFRCYYLPSEPENGCTDEKGWSQMIRDPGSGSAHPYMIKAEPLGPGENTFYIGGKTEIVDERYWDDWYVLSISADYTGSEHYFALNDRMNYVILLNEGNAGLIYIVGTDDIEELQKIAANLEIRQSNLKTDSKNVIWTAGGIGISRG